MKIVCSNKSLARALKTVFEKDDFVKECEVHPKEAGSLAFLKLTNQNEDLPEDKKMALLNFKWVSNSSSAL